MNPPIAILGAGSWGSALAVLLAGKDLPVRLWGRDPKHIAAIESDPRQSGLPARASPLPELVTPTVSLADAVRDAHIVLVVTPSRALRTMAGQLARIRALAPQAPCWSVAPRDSSTAPACG